MSGIYISRRAINFFGLQMLAGIALLSDHPTPTQVFIQRGVGITPELMALMILASGAAGLAAGLAGRLLGGLWFLAIPFSFYALSSVLEAVIVGTVPAITALCYFALVDLFFSATFIRGR